MNELEETQPKTSQISFSTVPPTDKSEETIKNLKQRAAQKRDRKNLTRLKNSQKSDLL